MRKTANTPIISKVNKMCGICGFNWEDKKLVKAMSSIMAYRGPDQHGIFTDKNISLGHLRLSIIDLSEKGKQPMQNEDGAIQIVFNGEIYNYLDIRKELEKKGHKFNSNTDTEVIIHAYEEYGTKSIEKFNGMFAFVIWDSKNKTIFIARDRIGIKPLYYYFDKEKFIFASEIKSILQDSQIKREINEKGLKQLILYAHHTDGETLFENIKELLPGHCLIFKNNTINIKEYWSLNIKENIEKFSNEKLSELLKDAVDKRLLSDVPLGATLSGGIDSSVIVALMSKLRQEPPKTFTLGIEDYDEDFKMSRIVAEYCKTEHVEKSASYEYITKNIPKILWHMEYPYGRPAVILTYLIAKEIKPQMTVSLIGDGADEIFAGYNRYFDAKKITNPEKIHYALSGYFNNKAHMEKFVNKKLNINKFEKDELDNLFLRYFKNKKYLLNQNLLMDTELEIPGIQLSRVDKMSMAFSVEMRVPFLDHRLVEYCINLDPKFKINQKNKKYMLQQVGLKLLPKETALRKKLPFGFPLIYYFKNGFIDIVNNIFDKKVGIKNYIKLENIKKTIKMARSGKIKEDNSFRQLLFLTNLEIFYKMFIESDKINSPNLNINSYI